MVVDDAAAARTKLTERGVDVSDVQEFPWGNFVFFKDPDGNGWALQGDSPQPRAGLTYLRPSCGALSPTTGQPGLLVSRADGRAGYGAAV